MVSTWVGANMPTTAEIDQHFDTLVRSAFDFVERAISSFSDHERISLFLFATGLELFTKARLYHEHWSLIFANVDQAEFRRFETGDLRTVGAEKANDRIKQILGHNLPASFEVIRQHRNRIAHFTHGTTAQQRTEIVSHQVQGWFDLYHLLRNDWKLIFKKYRKRYNDLERKMRKHREFLDTKFQAIQPDLEKERAAGNQIHLCPACGYEAMSVWLLGGVIYHGNCRVCGRIENYVSQPCMNDDCKHPIAFFASDGAPEHCLKCEDVYAENLKEALDTDSISIDDYQSRSPINCPYCSGYHSVVTHHDGYVCTECFEYEDEVGFCGWCAEGQLGGVGEFSELSGCEFCDGKTGWDRD
jgi:hypothetical protein